MFSPPVEVELPALIDVETDAWLWAALDGFEILSLSTPEATRTFVENVALQRANLQALLPQDLRATWDRPIQMVLYGKENPRPMPMMFVVILQKKFTDEARAKALENREPKPLEAYVDPRIIPGTWVAEADSVCVFNLVSAKVKASELSEIPAPTFVTYVMEARNPPLPKWLVIGFNAFYSRASVLGRDMDLPPVIWISRAQTQMMLMDRKIDPEFAPMADVFAGLSAASPKADDKTRELLESQAGLFVRWAFDPKTPGGTEALWKFARGATTGPGSEAWFQECFGMTHAGAIETLKAYLPNAMRRPLHVVIKREGKLPAINIRQATPSEVARTKGEWDRLAGKMVAKEHPELRPYFDEQARRTLARGPDNATADPELLASRALLAVDTGNDEAALPLLEAACAGAHPRPRAVVELTRIRLARARATLAVDAKFDDATKASLLGPLTSVLDLRPSMPRAFQLMVEIWASASTPPSSADLDRLVRGVQATPGDAALVVAAARLLLDVGRIDDARAMIEAGLVYATDDGGRRRLYAIRSAARAAAPK